MLQAALVAAAEYDGLSTIYLTAGKTYKVTRELRLAAGWSNITIAGTGTIHSVANDCFYTLIHPDEYPATEFAEASEGASHIVAPGHDLHVGDDVLIYTGQAITNSFTDDEVGNPDSELNTVTAIRGDRVYLRRPLAKNYRQEYYPIGGAQGTAATSTTETGDAAPMAVRKVEPVRNFTLDGITILHDGDGSVGIGWGDGGTQSGAAFAANKVGFIGLTFNNVTAVCNWCFMLLSASSDITMSNCDIHVELDRGTWFSVAYGARDATVTGCTFTSDTIGYIHIHEGSSYVHIDGTTMVSAPAYAGSDWSVIGLRGRGYHHTLSSVEVTNASNGSGACLRVDEEISSGYANGCTFDISAGGDFEILNYSVGFTVDGAPGTP